MYKRQPKKIVVDGQFNRFSSEGRPSDKPGWYVLNDLTDGVIAGAFGCWRSIDKVKWSSVTEAKLDKQQQRRIKDAIKKSYLLSEQERKTLQEKASKYAENLCSITSGEAVEKITVSITGAYTHASSGFVQVSGSKLAPYLS